MTVEQLRDELDRIVKQGAGHLPVRVEVSTAAVYEFEDGREETQNTDWEDVPVVDLSRINSGGTFLRLILDRERQ